MVRLVLGCDGAVVGGSRRYVWASVAESGRAKEKPWPVVQPRLVSNPHRAFVSMPSAATSRSR